MGCSKNLVDSQQLMKMLQLKGYSLSHDAEMPEGEYVVVNTCGFIGDAKEESVNLLLELCELKSEGRIGKIVVMGCLSERYMEELKAEIPEIDLWYGKFDWRAFASSLPMRAESQSNESKPWERVLTGNPWSAYLKISEGCNRFCAFCAIPLITGRHKSRPIEEIEAEVKQLVADGVKEFNVIAQDLSSYGTDLYGRHALAELLERISDIPGVEWIRLHYAYPADFPYDILPVMRERKNICNYLDIALQHSSDNMLTRMRRRFNREQTIELLERIRREVPGIKLRTTLMVGFPGETGEDFRELMEFVEQQKFERMGAFAYSEEEGTFGAEHYEDDVEEEVKQRRLDDLMSLQADIADTLSMNMLGKKVKVLVEYIDGEGIAGRTEFDSPEVDGEIFVEIPEGEPLPEPGDFILAEVVKASGYDLYGKMLTSIN